jgi:hypothetical protein
MGIDGLDYALIIGIVAPQIPGAVFTFWRRRRLRWFVRLALILVPALAFWAFTDFHFTRVAHELRARGTYVCGMFAFMAAFVVFGGTALQLALGALLQACHVFFSRRRERRLSKLTQAVVAV